MDSSEKCAEENLVIRHRLNHGADYLWVLQCARRRWITPKQFLHKHFTAAAANCALGGELHSTHYHQTQGDEIFNPETTKNTPLDQPTTKSLHNCYLINSLRLWQLSTGSTTLKQHFNVNVNNCINNRSIISIIFLLEICLLINGTPGLV